MSFAGYKRTILSWHTLKKLVSSFFQAFGALALLLSVFEIFFPNKLNIGYPGLAIFSGLSFLWAIVTVIPRRNIARQLSVPETKITIKIGDLFKEDAHLVIGMSDVFDTEKGDIIKPTSIQGQFLTTIYNNDRARLDNDLDNALRGISGKQDKQKSSGKNIRYPIGTVATLTMGTKKYFCSAYSHMGSNLKAQSDIKKLSTSLELLWDEIRLKGQGEKVAMAVIGSDLARVGHTASHSNLIKLIVSSFILASREGMITQELAIIIHPSKLERVNMMELNEFLQNF
jgi:hypothetical protein